MENSIILTVNLAGAIEGPVPAINSKKYAGRHPVKCTRTTNVPGHVVSSWINEGQPSWVRLSRGENWKKLSAKRRVKLYIASFDEGFGVFYESVGDGEN